MATGLAALRFETILVFGRAALVLATFSRTIFRFATLGLAAFALSFLAGAAFFTVVVAAGDFFRKVGRLTTGLRAGRAFFLLFPGNARFM